MARRHPALVPLASDHYNGLALALRLQQGTKALTRMWSHDLKFQAGYVVSFFQTELQHHFVVEEKVLFPVVVRHVKEARAIVDDLLNDHRAMESMVKRFCEPVSTALAQELNEFGRILEHHIRKEDRQLFPLFETQAPPEVLKRTEQKIQEFYPTRSQNS